MFQTDKQYDKDMDFLADMFKPDEDEKNNILSV